MVDREIFSRRLAALADYLHKASAFRATTKEEFIRRPELHDLAERYLHLLAECMLDLANHYVADTGLGIPETNKDTFTLLETAGEISPELAAQLRQWAGFRNVLAHDYLTLDHGLVWQIIHAELGTVDAFAHWATSKL